MDVGSQIGAFLDEIQRRNQARLPLSPTPSRVGALIGRDAMATQELPAGPLVPPTPLGPHSGQAVMQQLATPRAMFNVPTRGSLQAEMAGGGARPMIGMDSTTAPFIGDTLDSMQNDLSALERQHQIDMFGPNAIQAYGFGGGHIGPIDEAEMASIMGRRAPAWNSDSPDMQRNWDAIPLPEERVNPAAQALSEGELSDLGQRMSQPDLAGGLKLSHGQRMNREGGYPAVIAAARAQLAGQDVDPLTIDGSALYSDQRKQQIKDQRAAGKQRQADRLKASQDSVASYNRNLGLNGMEQVQADFMRQLLGGDGDGGGLRDTIARQMLLGPGADGADERASRERIAQGQIDQQDRERKNALESGTQGRVIESMKSLGMAPPQQPLTGSDKEMAAYQQQLRAYNDTYERLFAQQWSLDHGGELPPDGVGLSPFRIPYDDGPQDFSPNGPGAIPTAGTEMSASRPGSGWIGKLGPLSVLLHSLGLAD